MNLFEKWQAESAARKKKNPVKYFFNEAVPRWFRFKYMKYWETPIHWIGSYLIRKDHMLDLRHGPCYGSYGDWGGYKWGNLSGKDTLEVACFKSLERHMKFCDINYGGIDRQIDMLRGVCAASPNPHDIKHLKNARDLKDIHTFFIKDLPALHDLRHSLNLDEDGIEAIMKIEQRIEDKVTDNLSKLVSLRSAMQ